MYTRRGGDGEKRETGALGPSTAGKVQTVQGPILPNRIKRRASFFSRHFSIVNEIFNKMLLASKALHK